MKRGLMTIALSLLLGATSTIAIALSAGAWLRVRWYDETIAGRTTADGSGWYLRVYRRPGAACVEGWPLTNVENTWDCDRLGRDLIDLSEIVRPAAFCVEEPSVMRATRWRHLNARGWPKLALCWDVSWTGEDFVPVIRDGLPWELGLDPVMHNAVDNDHAALPFRPLWAGFIVDVLVHGAFWYCLIAISRVVRRKVVYFTRRIVIWALSGSLLLGMITTFGVAAYCAFWVHHLFAEYQDDDGLSETIRGGSRYGEWYVSRNREAGALRLTSVWGPRMGFVSGPGPSGPIEEFLPYWTDFLEPTAKAEGMRVVDARGWPLLSMWGGLEIERVWIGRTRNGSIIGTPHAVVWPAYDDAGSVLVDRCRVLPLAPIWPGFMVDTAFYGTAWLLFMFLLAGPAIVVRTIRHKRGRCPKCGYDLRGQLPGAEGCPECGWNRQPEAAMTESIAPRSPAARD